ncbi:hypothetical protein V6N13_032910 [Hibiscus sabdariffa]
MKNGMLHIWFTNDWCTRPFWNGKARQEAANKVHEHVCLEIVVVTQSLDRKLHAFDVLFEYDGAKWNCYRTIAEMQRINGSFGHEWSWPSLTGLQSEKLHHGPLILGVLDPSVGRVFIALCSFGYAASGALQ